jgi:cytochrome c peroxidase
MTAPARQSSWLLATALLLLASCTNVDETQQKTTSHTNEGRATEPTREPIQALPETPPVDPALVALGKKLFYEKRLSSDRTIACSSCHDPTAGGDDGLVRSKCVGGRQGAVNTPTVLNASLNFVLFWDGRAATLEEQIDGPVTNPVEMNSKWPDVVAELRRDSSYVAQFGSLFEDDITPENIKTAIATFERTLLTHGSPFDRWIEGDEKALTPAQKNGYEVFKSVGCIACHQGRNVGGNMFQRLGVLGDYFADRGELTTADYGRFNVTHDESDRFVFRVPALRNVELTAPYFHDGSAQTLNQAVQVMAKYQLGRKLTDAQVASIISFFTSLTGRVPEQALLVAP